METTLLKNMVEGNKEAFKQIFDTYYKSIFLFVLKYVKNKEIAEDVSQEVFIKVWENKREFSSSVGLRAYLYQAAKNRAINVLEHEKVKKKHQAEALLESNKDEFFYRNLIEQETKRQLLENVKKLPPKAQKVILLSLQGIKNQEIAERLDISVHTVKNHKAAAFNFLKIHLRDLLFLLLFIAK